MQQERVAEALSSPCQHLRLAPCHASFFSSLFGTSTSEEGSKKVALKSEWWLSNTDLFKEIENEGDWIQEMESGGIVVIDWAAVWCRGCEKAHTHVGILASNAEMRKKGVRWARVLMVEGNSFHKGLAKAQNVSKIPQITVHERGEQLASFPAPQNTEAAKLVAKNLATILSSPGQKFSIDPNGFLIAKGPRSKLAQEVKVTSQNKTDGGECADDSCAADWA